MKSFLMEVNDPYILRDECYGPSALSLRENEPANNKEISGLPTSGPHSNII